MGQYFSLYIILFHIHNRDYLIWNMQMVYLPVFLSLSLSQFLSLALFFSWSCRIFPCPPKKNTQMKQEQIFLNIIQFMILTNAMANSNIFKLNFFSSSLVNFTYLGFFALIFQCDRMLKPFGFMLY